jgi:hypothetical protein
MFMTQQQHGCLATANFIAPTFYGDVLRRHFVHRHGRKVLMTHIIRILYLETRNQFKAVEKNFIREVSAGFWRQKKFLNGKYSAQSRAGEQLEPPRYKNSECVIKTFLPCL